MFRLLSLTICIGTTKMRTSTFQQQLIYMYMLSKLFYVNNYKEIPIPFATNVHT